MKQGVSNVRLWPQKTTGLTFATGARHYVPTHLTETHLGLLAPVMIAQRRSNECSTLTKVQLVGRP